MNTQLANNIVTWAKNIANDNTWHYNKWNSNKLSHVCPICNNTAKGRYHGWNCIGFAWACWHHGGGLNCKCNNSVIDNTTAEKINKATDAKALSIVKSKCGLNDIVVIRNGSNNNIPKKNLQVGDICLNFVGNTYQHTFLYIGNGKMVDSQGSSGTISNNDQIKVRNACSARIAIRYTGGATGTPTGQSPSASYASAENIIEKELAACKEQAIWMKNYTYNWIKWNPKTVARSKYYGTCVTYVACVLQRIGVLKSGQYIWMNDNHKVIGANNKMDVAYLSGTLKSHKNELKAGDILIGGKGSGKVDATVGSHIFIITGKWKGDVPYVWDNHSGKEKGQESYLFNRNNFRLIARVRLKGGFTTDSSAEIDLRQGISKLWSSANYERIVQEDKDDELVSRFYNQIHDTLNNIKFTPITPDSSAIPEIVLSNEIEELDFEREKPKKLSKTKGTILTSFPSLVEAPTIVLDFNGTKIGGYGNTGDKYPNYISSMKVQKINGRINKYTINLIYQVRPGEDPNFIDKLLSQTGYTNPLKILYGDSNYPSSYFREEEALIMDVRYSENVKAYTINYTISAISSIGAAQTSYKTFKSRIAKPSTAIYDLLYNSGEISDSLLSLFPGMRNKTLVANNNLIPTSDSSILIGGMENVSPLTYLSYLVSCMKSTNSNSSTYYLSYVDNAISKYGGSYFKISEIESRNGKNNLETPTNSYVFELDIGYPSDNFVTNFQLCTDNYWPLVYEYAGSIPKWDYSINNNGEIVENKVNIVTENSLYSETSITNSNWWRQVTEFPISAKVTLKGLVSPALLMSYIRINTLFYGVRDMASGLYVVTQQIDSISGNGYSTELTLLRVAED